MRLKSNRTYSDTILMVAGVIILGTVVAIFMKGYTWLFELIPVSIVLFLGIRSKFNTAVIVENNELTIEYIQAFKRKSITFHADDIVLKLIKCTNKRKRRYYYHYILKVTVKDVVQWELNTQDGFSVDELIAVMNNLNKPDNQSY